VRERKGTMNDLKGEQRERMQEGNIHVSLLRKSNSIEFLIIVKVLQKHSM